MRVTSPHTGHSVIAPAYGAVAGSANSSHRTSCSVGPSSTRSQSSSQPPEYGEDQAHTVVRCRSASACANAFTTAALVGASAAYSRSGDTAPLGNPPIPSPRPAGPAPRARRRAGTAPR